MRQIIPLLRVRRARPLFPVALSCLGAALILALIFTARPKPPVPLLADDNLTVYAGAPKGDSRVFFSKNALQQGLLMLVSPEHPLPNDYAFPNVRSVRQMVGAYLPAEESTLLTEETIYALCDMQAHLQALTIEDGALSPAQQTQKRRDAYERFLKVTDISQAALNAQSAVPAAGESEHHLGTCFDITLTGPLEMGKKDALLQSPQGIWLSQNMDAFGFIRRYPLQKSAVTEGNCEKLHLRYVGKLHATLMRLGGFCLEEYLSFIRENAPFTLYDNQKAQAYIYCISCAGDQNILLPEGRAYASFDNTGYAIFWVLPDGSK